MRLDYVSVTFQCNQTTVSPYTLTFFLDSYQDLADLEEAVTSCSPEGAPVTQFDTSCFSGEYITGQIIGDDYFKKLHEARNDTAQVGRNTTDTTDRKRALPQQSNNGCDSISNDKRHSIVREDSCEPIANNHSLALVS
jgi:hypothetical protein